MFEVGQEVVCFMHGDGLVIGINNSTDYPVKVRFTDAHIGFYTIEGKLLEEYKIPNLYPHGTTFTITEPEVIFEEGEIVEVRLNKKDAPRLRRYHSKKRGAHFCYMDGHGYELKSWPHVRKPQPFVKSE